MKKSKLITIIAATLVIAALISVLSGCGTKTYKIKSYVNSYGKYESSDNVVSKAEKIDGLTNAKLVSSTSGLGYFTALQEENGHTKHMIYDPEQNKIIATYIDNTENTFEISLYYNSYIGQSYYTVVTTHFTYDIDSTSWYTTSYTTDLYSCKAEKIDSVQSKAYATNAADMIYFDGKLYGEEKSKIEFLFEYSPLADRPSNLEKHGKYYYEFDNDFFSVYNSELELLSSFATPKYIEDGYAYTVLENGNVLVQYVYAADDNAEDYTLIYDDNDELKKFYLVTLIVNHKNGKVKEIESNYVFNDSTRLNVPNADFKYSIRAEALVIENKRLSVDEQLVFIDNNGNGIAFEEYMGLTVSNIVQVAENRWKVSTENGKRYLINERAELIGDITNAITSHSDKFITVNGDNLSGKIYDYSLNEIFDASDLTFYSMLGSSVIYRNSDGEYLLYSGSDSAKTIVAKDSGVRFIEVLSGKFYVLYTGSALELYNANGEKVISTECNNATDALNHSFSIINCGGYTLLSLRENVNNDQNKKTVYYIIK